MINALKDYYYLTIFSRKESGGRIHCRIGRRIVRQPIVPVDVAHIRAVPDIGGTRHHPCRRQPVL